jgi:phosphoglycolate phosphatase-like HAD superfamily hydrolase
MVASASDYRDRVSDLSGVLVLWDIDGTLVTHAPSPRDRHAHAVSTVLGRKVEPIPAGIGKTDRQIMVELFADHLPSEAEIEKAFEVIDSLTEEDMETAPSIAIDGVLDALVALSDSGAEHSVLTGNSPARAQLKLRSAGLAEHIDFDSGFYGHIHSTRMELVAAAAERLSLQQGIRPIIVGDTPLDILAAHASGFPVVATTTGIFDAAALEEHRPDAVMSDFSDARAFTETITAIVSP